jgi:hypothetical protein
MFCSIDVHYPYSSYSLASNEISFCIITLLRTDTYLYEIWGCFDNTFLFGPHCLEISPSGQ